MNWIKIHNGIIALRVGFSFFCTSLFFFISCAGSRFHPTSHAKLPGVEDRIARIAKEDAKMLFVPYQDKLASIEEKNKGVIHFDQYLNLDTLFQSIASPNDTLVIQKINRSPVTDRYKKNLIKIWDKKGIDQLHLKLKDYQEKHLDRASQYFEKANRYNPFDEDNLFYLYQIFVASLKLDISASTKKRQASKLNQLLSKALAMDRGDALLFYAYGKTHQFLRQYDKGLSAFDTALQNLHSFSFLPGDPLSDSFEGFLDSLAVFRNLYSSGDTYVKLYDSQNALNRFHDAAIFAGSSENKKRLDTYIEWIQWADGNIRAREIFEEADSLETIERYDEASALYRQVIDLTKQNTRPAFWETSWRLSKIEEAFSRDDSLDLLTGLDRLRMVIQEIPKDSLGSPLENTYQIYLNDFAGMLINEGNRKYRIEGEKKGAENVFAEGAVLISGFQAKCCLRMTRIYQNARLRGLLWALKTFALRNQLNREEMDELSVLFKRVTRRPRNPWLTQFFNDQFRYILDGITPSRTIEDDLRAYELLRAMYLYLEYYLYENYTVREDPLLSKEYDNLYRNTEKKLSSRKVKEIRDEITDYYYRNHFKQADEKRIFTEWRHHLRQL